MSWVVYSETVRRHLYSPGYGVTLAMFALAAFFSARFESLATVWPPLVQVLAVVLGCAPIGPEFSSGTLQLILVKPVNRAAYLLSRVAGVVTAVWIVGVAACAAELLGRAVHGQPLQAVFLGKTLLNVAIASILIASLLTLFGTFTRAYFNVALYMLLQIGLGVSLSLAALGRRFPAITRMLEQVLNNLFPEPPPNFNTAWTLMVLSNAAVALVLACFFFRRREVPYGAD